MRGDEVTHSLLFLIFISSVLGITHFNISAPCVSTLNCSFLDPATWVGGVVPGSADDVLVVSSTPINLILDRGPNVIIVTSMNIQGPVTFIVTDSITFRVITELNWDFSATVRVEIASIVTEGAKFNLGSSLYVTNGRMYGNNIRVTTATFIDADINFKAEIFAGSIVATRSILVFDSVTSRSIDITEGWRFEAQTVSLSGLLNIAVCYYVDINMVGMSNHAVIEYRAPNDTKMENLYSDMRCGTLQVYDYNDHGTFILHDGAKAYVTAVYGFVDYVFGNNSELVVASTAWFGKITQPANSTMTMYAAGSLTFFEDTVFHGVIKQFYDLGSRSTINTRKNFVMIPPNQNDGCFVNRPNLIIGTNSRFECVNSSIEALELVTQMNATLTASKVKAVTIVAINSTINADVDVNNLEIQEYPLLVNGDFYQHMMSIQGEFSILKLFIYPPHCSDSLLVVRGSIGFSLVQIIVSFGVKPDFSHGKKLAIAESKTKSIIRVHLPKPQTLEAVDEESNFYYTVSIEDSVIYLSRTTLELFQVLIAITASVTAILALFIYYYLMWKRSGRLRQRLPVPVELQLLGQQGQN